MRSLASVASLLLLIGCGSGKEEPAPAAKAPAKPAPGAKPAAPLETLRRVATLERPVVTGQGGRWVVGMSFDGCTAKLIWSDTGRTAHELDGAPAARQEAGREIVERFNLGGVAYQLCRSVVIGEGVTLQDPPWPHPERSAWIEGVRKRTPGDEVVDGGAFLVEREGGQLVGYADWIHRCGDVVVLIEEVRVLRRVVGAAMRSVRDQRWFFTVIAGGAVVRTGTGSMVPIPAGAEVLYAHVSNGRCAVSASPGGAPKWSLDGVEDFVPVPGKGLALCPTAKAILVVSLDGKIVRELARPKTRIAVTCSADGRFAAVVEYDRYQIVDLDRFEVIAGQACGTDQASFCAKGDHFVAPGRRSLAVWSAATRLVTHAFIGDLQPVPGQIRVVSHMAFGSGERRFFTFCRVKGGDATGRPTALTHGSLYWQEWAVDTARGKLTLVSERSGAFLGASSDWLLEEKEGQFIVWDHAVTTRRATIAGAREMGYVAPHMVCAGQLAFSATYKESKAWQIYGIDGSGPRTVDLSAVWEEARPTLYAIAGDRALFHVTKYGPKKTVNGKVVKAATFSYALLDVASGRVLREGVAPMGLSADGKVVVVLNTTAKRIEAQRGEDGVVLCSGPVPSNSTVPIAFSPSGRYIAYLLGGQVAVLDLTAGSALSPVDCMNGGVLIFLGERRIGVLVDGRVELFEIGR